MIVRIVAGLLVTAGLALAATGVAADTLMEISESGTISSGLDYAGLFTQADTSLSGQFYTLSLDIDLSLGYYQSRYFLGTFNNSVQGGSGYLLPDIGYATLTIDGHSSVIDSDYLTSVSAGTDGMYYVGVSQTLTHQSALSVGTDSITLGAHNTMEYAGYLSPDIYAPTSGNLCVHSTCDGMFAIDSVSGVGVLGASGSFAPSDYTIKLINRPSLPPAQVPTVAQLASMSTDAYNVGSQDPSTKEIKSFGSFKYITEWTSSTDGFYADIYKNGDNYVVAIRGTAPDLGTSTIEQLENELATDKEIAEGGDSSLLRGYVNQALSASAYIKQQDPNAHVTFTGHSLGGAVAEVTGYITGRPATGFDSPAVGNVVSQYGTPPPDSAGQISTYRMYGDQISLAGGTSIGNVYTVGGTGAYKALIDNSLGVAQDTLPRYPILSAAVLVGEVLNAHLPGTIAQALQGSSPFVDIGVTGPAVVSDILKSLVVAQIISEGIQDIFQANGDAVQGEMYLFDPPGFIKLQVVLAPGSPYFQSVTLTDAPGLKDYKLSTLQDGVWSAYNDVTPDSTLRLGSGVGGLAFEGVGLDGRPFAFPDTYLFDVSFASSGPFSATIVETPTAVPEPGTWSLLVSGFALMGMLLRKRRVPLRSVSFASSYNVRTSCQKPQGGDRRRPTAHRYNNNCPPLDLSQRRRTLEEFSSRSPSD